MGRSSLITSADNSDTSSPHLSHTQAQSEQSPDQERASQSASALSDKSSESAKPSALAKSAASARKPRHHASVLTRTRVMRFIVSPILLTLALICAVFAILTMTVWRPSPLVSATTTVSTRYAVTDPGVLGLVDKNVGIRVKAEQPICAALATSQDAAGWISGQQHTRITGLDSWTALSTRTQIATVVADSGGTTAFKDSDMWQRVQCGSDITLQTSAAPSSSRVLLIDTNVTQNSADSQTGQTNSANGTAGNESSDSSTAVQTVPATITLTWKRMHMNDAALPLWLSAALLFLASGVCFFIFSLSARRRRKARERVENEVREDPSIEKERSQHKPAGDDAPRWANDNLRSHRRRESRHRHAHHRGVIMTIRELAHSSKEKNGAGSAKSAGANGSQQVGSDASADPSSLPQPVVTQVERTNMVARLQETQTMAPISAPIRTDGVGTKIDNGDGRPPSYTPPSSEELQEYLHRLAQEQLGADLSSDDDSSDDSSAGSLTDSSQTGASHNDSQEESHDMKKSHDTKESDKPQRSDETKESK